MEVLSLWPQAALPNSCCGTENKPATTMWSPPCEPCSHSPRSSIHRLTYTPTPPCHRTGSRKTLIPAETVTPVSISPSSSPLRPCVPPLLIIFTLALLCIQPLPLSCSSLSSHSSSCLQPLSSHRFKYTHSPSVPVFLVAWTSCVLSLMCLTC